MIAHYLGRCFLTFGTSTAHSLIRSLLRNCETSGLSNFFLSNCSLSPGITIGIRVGFCYFHTYYGKVSRTHKYLTGKINTHREELLSLFTVHSLFVYSLHFSLWRHCPLLKYCKCLELSLSVTTRSWPFLAVVDLAIISTPLLIINN